MKLQEPVWMFMKMKGGKIVQMTKGGTVKMMSKGGSVKKYK